EITVVIAIVAVAVALGRGVWKLSRTAFNSPPFEQVQPTARSNVPPSGLALGYSKRITFVDSSGFAAMRFMMPNWKPDDSLKRISEVWTGAGHRAIEGIDQDLAGSALTEGERIVKFVMKSALLNCEGESRKSYEVLEQLRAYVLSDKRRSRSALSS